jgi:hypothetical protein
MATVSITTTRAQYVGTGTDAAGVETIKTLDTDYTVSGAGDDAGGNVTFTTAPASTETVTILRALPQKQETDYVPHDPFPALAHENSMDKITHMIQELQEQLDRTAKLKQSSNLTGIGLPDPSANKLLGWDASANDLANFSTTAVSVPQIDHIGNHGNSLAQAVTDIGATKTLLWVHVANNVTANLTVPANIILRYTNSGITTISNTVTLTINGPITAGRYQIFSCTGTGIVAFTNNYSLDKVPVEWWGAVGNDSTDCTTAIKKAIDSCYATGQEVTFGVGTYLISSKLTFRVPMSGQGMNWTVIKATGTWTDTMMLDLYDSVALRERMYIKGMRWDANSKAIQCFGSSSDGAGQSQALFEMLMFKNSQHVVGAVGAVSAGFINCRWGLPSQGGIPFRLGGINTSFYGGFIFFGNIPSDGGVKALFKMDGWGPVKFDGIFFETNSSDITHVFHVSGVHANIEISNCQFRLDNAAQSAGLLALIRTNVRTWAADDSTRYFSLRNLVADWESADWKLLDLYVGSETATDIVVLDVHGVDSFAAPVFQWASGSSSVYGNLLHIHGIIDGARYNHTFSSQRGTGTSQSQVGYENARSIPGWVTENSDSISGGGTISYTLPEEGVFLLTLVAKQGGSDSQMAIGTWMVIFIEDTNDLLDSEQIGTSQFSSGGNLNVLSLSDPTTAGVVSATINGSGFPTTVICEWRLKKLHNFYGYSD